MRKLLLSLALVLGITTSATADITFVVPQKPGAGTTVWTEIVAKELEPFLGEKINIKLKPFQRGDMLKTHGSKMRLKKIIKNKKFLSFKKGIKKTLETDYFKVE